MATPDKTVFEREQNAPNIMLTDEQLNMCRIALAHTNRRVVAYYSNPKLSNPGMMLNLTADMNTMVSFMNPFDYYLAHYTTKEIMENAIVKYNPEIVCYFGHADVSHIYLESSDPRVKMQPLNADEFIEILQKNQTSLKCIALFACSTYDIAQRVSVALPHTHIIFWHTKTLDEGARIFARAFIEYISKYKYGEHFRIEHAYHDGYNKFTENFQIGDPLEKYQEWMRELGRARISGERPDVTKKPADGIPGIMLNGIEIPVAHIVLRRSFKRALSMTNPRDYNID